MPLAMVLRVFCLVFALAAGGAAAEERLALVIGNSAYSTVSPLDNPANDAGLIAGTLEQVGFRVTLLVDAHQAEMKAAIARFGRDLRDAGADATGLFYYAGHGVQSFGANYLLPVDVALADAADLDLVAVEAQSVLRQMYSARNRTNIMILDACRNNPFEAIPEFDDNGLAEMKAPTGSFVAYATAPGDVALDGLEGNSPFTRALAGQMVVPGQPIEQMFKQVRIAVIQETGGGQTPWDSSSLTGDFIFASGPPRGQMSAGEVEELQVWQAVQASADPVQLMLFLRGYPNGKYADEAQRLLAAVMENELKRGYSVESPASGAGPDDGERRMLEAAQAEGTVAGYEAYLLTYPAGVYAEFVRQEIAALKRGQGADTSPGGAPVPAATIPDPGPAPKAADAGPVTFASPLVSDLPEVTGRTIAELILGLPLFPPVEGLPEAYWKSQTCAGCHQWTRDLLCEQAKSYLSLNMQRSLDKQHPLGGDFKRSLKSWAAGGCQ